MLDVLCCCVTHRKTRSQIHTHTHTHYGINQTASRTSVWQESSPARKKANNMHGGVSDLCSWGSSAETPQSIPSLKNDRSNATVSEDDLNWRWAALAVYCMCVRMFVRVGGWVGLPSSVWHTDPLVSVTFPDRNTIHSEKVVELCV